jgi:hypothetical protein
MEVNGPIRAINYPHEAIRWEPNNLMDLIEASTLDTNFDEILKRVSLLSDFVGFHVEAGIPQVHPPGTLFGTSGVSGDNRSDEAPCR